MYATRSHVEEAPVQYTEEVDLRTIEWLKKDLERRREMKAGAQDRQLVSS